MDYEILYQIKNKLNSLSSHIKELEKYGIDTNDYIYQLNKLNNSFSSIEEVNDIGSCAFMMQNKESLQNLNQIVDSFYEFIIKITKYLRIFNDIDNISTQLNMYDTEEKFNKLVSLILNDLLDYNELVKLGYDDNSSPIYDTLYKIIKKEIQINGNSLIYNFLINNNLGSTKISELMRSDTIKYRNDKDIYYLTQGRKIDGYINNVYLLNLISLLDSKTKDDMILSLTESKEKAASKEEEYNDKLSSYKKTKKKESYNNKEIFKNGFGIFKTIIPLITSLTIIISASNAMTNKYKKDSEYYLATCDNYTTTSLETKTKRIYESGLNINDAIITVYYPTSQDNERLIEKYYIKDTSLSAQELANLDISDKTPISSQTVKDLEANSISTDEFTSVNVVKEVDYTSNKADDNEEYMGVFFLYVLWLLVDFLVGVITYIEKDYDLSTVTHTIFKFTDTLIEPIGEYINEIKYYIENKESVKGKKELKVLKQELDELSKKYQELYDKYSKYEIVLEEKGFKKTLK